MCHLASTMSKWLKRGKGSNSSSVNPASQNIFSVENGPIASVQTNMSPAAAATPNHYSTTSGGQSQATMGGYATSSGPGMDVIDGGNYHGERASKSYHSSSHQNYAHGSGASGVGPSSTSQRRSTSRTRRHNSHASSDDGLETRNRQRSNPRRASGHTTSSRQRATAASQHSATAQNSYHYNTQPQPHVGPAGGPTNAPHGAVTNPPQHHSYEAAPPPPAGSAHDFQQNKMSASVTPPQDTVNPQGYPPAVSASNSHHSNHRRPAYLLHRDLVIGKGSYGQVCIASRGEAEGHTSGSGSGKRKKFACKCVVLRNDPKYIAKLQEEVNVLRELRGHENVIRLYDVFCVDNELFIITELGRGGDLFHLLTTHPKHGVTEAYAGE